MKIINTSSEICQILKEKAAGGWRPRLHVVRCPLENWHIPESRSLFETTITLRLAGYWPVYPAGTMPLDITDYVSTHFYLGLENRDQFAPLLTYKMVSLEMCKKYRLTFPPLGVAQAAQASSIERFLISKVSPTGIAPERIAYGGGWTAYPELRNDREFGDFLKEGMAAALTHFAAEENFSSQFCFGVLRFKTDQYFHRLGYSRSVNENGNHHISFGMVNLNGEPVVLLEWTAPTEFAKGQAERHRALWLDRFEHTTDKNDSGESHEKIAA